MNLEVKKSTYSSLELFKELTKLGVLSKEDYHEIANELEDTFQTLMLQEETEQTYWRRVRNNWAFTHKVPLKIPMNSANLCPAPTGIVKAINKFRVKYNENVAQQERQGAGAECIQQARFSLAKALNIIPCSTTSNGDARDVKELAIVRNTSEANNALCNGYRKWNSDGKDNVVIWKENHPTNKEAWFLRGGKVIDPKTGAKDGGVFGVKIVELSKEDTEETIRKEFLKRMDERTKFVSITETSSLTGIRIPRSVIASIYEKANELENCHVHVDGAQSWGTQPINLHPESTYPDDSDALKCHSFSASSHKWFCGPKATGILYMQQDKAKQFMPNIFAYDYRINIPDKFPSNARRFELIGQRDDVNIVAMLCTQNFLNQIGLKRIQNRIVELSTYLKEKLKQSGWKTSTPTSSNLSHGIVVINLEGYRDPTTLYDFLYERGGIATSAAGGLRLCPHIYNLKDDIDKAISLMNIWRKETQLV